MAKGLRIILRKSLVGRPAHQRRIVVGLGLRRIDQSVVRADTPPVRGMIAKVVHLVEVHPVDDQEGA